jgi:hypothetical protein
MKKISLVILVVAGILVGCTHTEKTASGGAIAGAGVGALLGNDARSAAVGAAIGGALGAGAGELTKNK